ncbi:MAG TPA: fructosamine kinase family protein [Rhodocyclaceae bacterium]|nr:fructosamine kinase family protein [Rhodocyclaceae bacterium]
MAPQHFIKTGPAAALPRFEAEVAGLAALRAAGAVRVPEVVSCGLAGGEAQLVLERLELAALDRAGGAALGRGLAELHRTNGPRFGWPHDNFIGDTPQENAWRDNWALFYAEHRLRPQLRLGAGNGLPRELLAQGEKLAEKLSAFFIDSQPVPSLLHGDLWSGNASALPDGTPVIFDPACYYGDREADLAMTELFGGFPESFYAAYRESWPLAEGFEARKTLYNLYHVLNHFNLFGGGYLGQAKRMIRWLLAELA